MSEGGCVGQAARPTRKFRGSCVLASTARLRTRLTTLYVAKSERRPGLARGETGGRPLRNRPPRPQDAGRAQHVHVTRAGWRGRRPQRMHDGSGKGTGIRSASRAQGPTPSPPHREMTTGMSGSEIRGGARWLADSHSGLMLVLDTWRTSRGRRWRRGTMGCRFGRLVGYERDIWDGP